jgi:AraC family transcriptional regulator
MVQSLVTEVLVGIARRTAHSEMSQVLHPYSPEVELARVYIERHSRHGLSIDEIARAVCASPSHLARRFSREMHIPIHCYTRRLLMQRAASLLEQGTLNVSEIAEHLGFSSIHFFSSSFKDYWGMSPTQYRQSISTLG